MYEAAHGMTLGGHVEFSKSVPVPVAAGGEKLA